jgi:type IV pilus assembly protein PilE
MTSIHGYRRAIGGFTLLEMTIVAVIIAILASVALPSYLSQLRRSHRASAQSHLMDITARQQQYLFDSRSYAPSLSALNMTTPTDVAADYTITIAANAGPPPSFLITAAPKGTQLADLGGAALTINNVGAKTPVNAW